MPGIELRGPVRTLTLIAVIVVAGASSRALVRAQTPAPMAILSRGPVVAVPRVAAPLDAWELRARQVALNTGALANGAAGDRALAATGQVTIDLFDGATITAVLDRYDPNDTGVTWVGHVPSQPGSLVTIVYGGGALAASIVLPGASYTIRPTPRDAGDTTPMADAMYRLVQTNGNGFQREAPPVEVPAPADEAARDVVMADTGEFIDVMVAYTPAAEGWAGGPAGMINWINVGMSETNSAYAASGVNQRVRLVHTVRVLYSEVGAFGTNLNNLRAGSAPGLQTIAALRNSYTADLVTLLVRPAAPDACGIAFLMTNVNTSFAPNGYSVVDSPCVSPNGTLAHELGHNMGLRHDWYVDSGVTPATYAHGHVNPVARFRTIMAYPDACSALFITCTRLLQFSNPDLTYLGQPGGVPGGTKSNCPTNNTSNMNCDADERRVLNDTALVVSNFREFSTDRPPNIVAHPQNKSIPRGQPLTLQVTAEGLGPLTYQWYRGTAPLVTSPIPGATGPSYTFSPGSDGVWFERWFYWVQVKNPIGTDDSFTATITLLPPAAAAPAGRRATVVADAPASQGHGGVTKTGVEQRSPRSSPATVASGHDGRPQGIAIAEVTAARTGESAPCQIATAEVVLEGMRRVQLESSFPRAMFALIELMNVMAEADPGCGGGRPLR
ncbi:MAG TPA: zinc-dependent metalloprotease family protein [Vicinamibacterales bacterium]|nr:zinc-dependent metalloprotease family protein [Vicinamibacterales bacterium]